ncbi:MAG: EFR1 family ferrodoxin [Methanocorpusculum sp.]|nr:EFR1 family ferrodoxin [Methanocorpusculum sp.]
MIYYFSGTGNSKWIALEIAKGISDEAVSIPDAIKNNSEPKTIKSGETFGIIFPVYAWDTPKIVKEFISKIKIEDGAFVFAVCTCGGECGNLFKSLAKIIKLNSGYSILMPNNYIVLGGAYSEDEIKSRIANAKEFIAKICASVSSKKSEFVFHKGGFAWIKTALISLMFNKFTSDRKFFAENSCSGCGLCSRLCPVENINLENEMPVWNHKCIQCMACIQHCPKEAIQYGKGTKDKVRYFFRE